MRPINFFYTTIFSLLFPVTLFAATAQLPATGQKSCYDSVGKEIACSGTGQDGELRTGIPVPLKHILDNNNGTVTDKLTGLVWLKNADCFGALTWQQALDVVKTLANGKCGLSDKSAAGKWRLPNINELESLADLSSYKPALQPNAPFSNLQSSYYWSSTTKVDEPVNALYLYTLQGAVGYAGKYSIRGSVLPVRDGEFSAPVKLPQTGQNRCFDEIGSATDCAGTGQDGDLKSGVQWPTPRFRDNGDRTITDNLTGLIWSQDGNAPGPASCVSEKYMTWQEALDYVGCLNRNRYLGFTDWRLPNRKEMSSLINMGEPDNGGWLRSSGFENTDQNTYWTSTSSAQRYSYVWISHNGHISITSKASVYNVWPLRGGKQ